MRGVKRDSLLLYLDAPLMRVRGVDMCEKGSSLQVAGWAVGLDAGLTAVAAQMFQCYPPGANSELGERARGLKVEVE